MPVRIKADGQVSMSISIVPNSSIQCQCQSSVSAILNIIAHVCLVGIGKVDSGRGCYPGTLGPGSLVLVLVQDHLQGLRVAQVTLGRLLLLVEVDAVTECGRCGGNLGCEGLGQSGKKTVSSRLWYYCQIQLTLGSTLLNYPIRDKSLMVYSSKVPKQALRSD